MCSPLARVRYDAHVQMQYQSQRSLVAAHKSAFAKAALAETENCVGKNRRAFYVYREAERKQDTTLPSAKKERHRRNWEERKGLHSRERAERNSFYVLYPRSGTSLSNESRVGKTSFAWQSQAQNYKVLRDGYAPELRRDNKREFSRSARI